MNRTRRSSNWLPRVLLIYRSLASDGENFVEMVVARVHPRRRNGFKFFVRQIFGRETAPHTFESAQLFVFVRRDRCSPPQAIRSYSVVAAMAPHLRDVPSPYATRSRPFATAPFARRKAVRHEVACLRDKQGRHVGRHASPITLTETPSPSRVAARARSAADMPAFSA
jgi:hypothetical protein